MKIGARLLFGLFYFLHVPPSWSQCHLDPGLSVEEQNRSLALLQRISSLSPILLDVKTSNATYKVHFCSSFEAKENVSALKIVSNQETPIGRVNVTSVIGGDDWLMLSYGGGAMYDSGVCNGTQSRTQIMILCDPDALEFLKWKYMGEHTLKDPACFYSFEVRYRGCPSSVTPQKAGLSGTSIFLLLLSTGFLVYFIVGVAYMRSVRGARGAQQIPNYNLWKRFGALQADGCNFCCRCEEEGEEMEYCAIPSNVGPMESQHRDHDVPLLQ
ncbi:unnamed protein product [Darwinula stevensoni]|uniref:Cation-dependent mannose-6-phosphate receptor n=1 Tax=Darwinula stevensoni TaxID=69355 RepID=A0A7R9A4K2_9CRUS|nr:unnamed protein product [Darwinula stevensoni]CAG0893741.1 unnamed protein product [Darwinula stevensoni]